MALDFAVTFTISEVPGASIKAAGSFKRKGPAEKIWISWGLHPGSGWLWTRKPKPGEIVHWAVYKQPMSMTDDTGFKRYSFVLTASFPSDFPHDRVDCYVAVESKRKIEVDGWWDDIYEWVAPEYIDLVATFT